MVGLGLGVGSPGEWLGLGLGLGSPGEPNVLRVCGHLVDQVGDARLVMSGEGSGVGVGLGLS